MPDRQTELAQLRQEVTAAENYAQFGSLADRKAAEEAQQRLNAAADRLFDARTRR